MGDSRRFRQWEIWNVRWYHEDGEFKVRPALLLTPSGQVGGDRLLFAKISGEKHNVPKRLDMDSSATGFASTGLKKTCYIYLGDVRELEKSDVIDRRGSLDAADAEIVAKEMIRR